MKSIFLFLSAVSAFSGVAMGAFGAHGLRNTLAPEMLVVYQTGVTYQVWHALGLGLIALLASRVPTSKLLSWAGWLMFAGIVLFSGSLYLLAISGAKWLGMLTPFGGTAWLLAWLLTGVYALKSNEGQDHA